MLNLGLLGMYFDAGVVFVTKSSLFSDWLWPYCGNAEFEVAIFFGHLNPCTDSVMKAVTRQNTQIYLVKSLKYIL